LEKNRRKKFRIIVSYINTNIVTKKRWKKLGKQLFQKQTNSANKKCWGKNRRKIQRKNVFYIHTNIVTKKWWKKTRETIFPETHQ